jgi:hypothetical protein
VETGGVVADYSVGGGDLIRSPVKPAVRLRPYRVAEWPLD